MDDQGIQQILDVLRSVIGEVPSFSKIKNQVFAHCGKSLVVEKLRSSRRADKTCFCCHAQVRKCLVRHPLWPDDIFCETCQALPRCAVCERRSSTTTYFLDQRNRVGPFDPFRIGKFENRNPLFICPQCTAAGTITQSSNVDGAIQTVLERISKDHVLQIDFGIFKPPIKFQRSSFDRKSRYQNESRYYPIANQQSNEVLIDLVDIHYLSRPHRNAQRVIPGFIQRQLFPEKLGSAEWGEDLVFGRCECLEHPDNCSPRPKQENDVNGSHPTKIHRPAVASSCSSQTCSGVNTPRCGNRQELQHVNQNPNLNSSRMKYNKKNNDENLSNTPRSSASHSRQVSPIRSTVKRIENVTSITSSSKSKIMPSPISIQLMSTDVSPLSTERRNETPRFSYSRNNSPHRVLVSQVRERLENELKNKVFDLSEKNRRPQTSRGRPVLESLKLKGERMTNDRLRNNNIPNCMYDLPDWLQPNQSKQILSKPSLVANPSFPVIRNINSVVSSTSPLPVTHRRKVLSYRTPPATPRILISAPATPRQLIHEARIAKPMDTSAPITRATFITIDTPVDAIYPDGSLKVPVSVDSLMTTPSQRVRRSGRVLRGLLVAEGLPEDIFGSTLAHELTHAYIFASGYRFPLVTEEGLCNAVCMIYAYNRISGYSKLIQQLSESIRTNQQPPQLNKLLQTYFPCERHSNENSSSLQDKLHHAMAHNFDPSTMTLIHVLTVLRERIILRHRLCVYRFRRMMVGDTEEYLAATLILPLLSSRGLHFCLELFHRYHAKLRSRSKSKRQL